MVLVSGAFGPLKISTHKWVPSKWRNAPLWKKLCAKALHHSSGYSLSPVVWRTTLPPSSVVFHGSCSSPVRSHQCVLEQRRIIGSVKGRLVLRRVNFLLVPGENIQLWKSTS